MCVSEIQVKGSWRLANGKTANEGRLEYNFDDDYDEWGSICLTLPYDPRNKLDYICQELGFTTFFSYQRYPKFGRGTGPLYRLGIYFKQLCDRSQELTLACSLSNDRMNYN